MKFISKDPREVGLKNVIAVTGHPVTVCVDREKNILCDLPVYKNPPRGIYESSEGIFHTKEAVGISDLPGRVTGLRYVVSRETLRIITKENEKIKKSREAYDMLQVVEKISDSEEKYILKKYLEGVIKENGSFFDEPRTDFLAPGEQLRDENGKVIACWGLITEFK